MPASHLQTLRAMAYNNACPTTVVRENSQPLKVED